MPKPIKTKYCPKCNKIKSISKFGKNKSRHDGLVGYCKKCFNEYIKPHHRRYMKSQKGKESQKKFLQSEKGKIYTKNAHNKYPIKRKARSIVSNAIALGKLNPPYKYKCKCGNDAQQYHHPDYIKPLYVIPMCNKCHKSIHNIL